MAKWGEIKCPRCEELEAKLATYEQRDGMDGAVVSAIRDLLNHHNVPMAAFIDDHVGNAIWQRNVAEAKLAKAVGQMQRVKDYRYDPNIGIELNRLEEALLNRLEEALAELKGEDRG